MSNAREPEEECPHTKSCAMYSLFKHAGTLSVFKINYCRGAYQTCARYQLSEQGRSVPLRLMPNGQTLKAPE